MPTVNGTTAIHDTACTGVVPLQGPGLDGGASRDRTGDLLLAKQALSQLSYGPAKDACSMRPKPWWVWEDLNFRPHPYQGCALTN
jgi:hypothetical protein